MTLGQEDPKGAAVVLGARNLGGAIARHLARTGRSVAAVARSHDSLAALEAEGIAGLRADAADPEALAGVLREAAEQLGPLELVVNAVSASRPPENDRPFGGGPIAEAGLDDFAGWTTAVAQQGFVFLSTGARALQSAGRGGTLVQITGGSSRRGMPGRGLWAAGAFGLRALVQASAQELREEGIHVALLAVDGTIDSPKTARMTGGQATDASVDQDLVARSVEYLAEQGSRALTHELTLTPAGDRWVP